MHRLLLKLSLALVLIAPASAPASVLALEKSVVWQRYDVDITVQSNGDLKVVETQVIEFQGGLFTTGFAAIPKKNSDSITDISVSEPGQAYTPGASEYGFAVTDQGSDTYVEWTFPALANETRTFLLSYAVVGSIRQYADHDVLQYQAIPDQQEFPILSSTITVHLPPGGTPLQDPDSVGARVKWETSLDSQTVTYTSEGAIQPYEGIGVGVIFKPVITGPKPSWQAASDAEAAQQEQRDRIGTWLGLGLGAIGLLLLFAVPAGLYLIWYLRGRDPKVGLVPEYIAAPPSETPPGIVGTLVDEKADLRDLTATLIDLARRGIVTLEERETPGSFGYASKSFILKKAGQPQGLRRYEQLLYDAVFAGQDERDLSKMPESFFAQLPVIENALYESATKEGGLFQSNPNAVRSGYATIGVVLFVLTLVVGFCALGSLSAYTSAAICPFIPLAGFGIGLAILSRAMPVKTRQGAEEAAKWQAFQTYLGNIQKYRNVAEATDQFEKYLPYAIAFGLERRWLNAFAQVPGLPSPVPAPIWYRPYRPVLVSSSSGGPAGSISKETDPGQANLPNQPGGLNQMGQGTIGGLNSIGDGLIGALNTAGRSFSIPPPPKYSGGGSRGYSGGSRSFSSGSFRSGGGGFRSGGFSGGGSRGFR